MQVALDDLTTHDDVHADHDRVVAAGGFGVPTLFLPDGTALYGPVVVDPPSGAEAVRLWEHVLAWRSFPALFEIKRPKSPADQVHIAETFRPYLEARDWITIENPAP